MIRVEPARAEGMAALGLSLGAAVYLATVATRVGVLYYLPARGLWTFTAPTGVVAMDWFARAFYTLAATCLGAAIGSRWAMPRPLARGVFRLGLAVLAWSLGFTVMLLAASR